MKNLLLIITLVLCIQKIDAQKPVANLVAPSVVLLSSKYPSKASGPMQIATGVWVMAKKNLYLVTAKHVADSIVDQSWYITFQDSLQNVQVLKLSDLVGRSKWKNHRKADLSVLKIRSNSHNTKIVSLPGRIIDPSVGSISADTTLTAFGFPNGEGLNFKYYNDPNHANDIPSALTPRRIKYHPWISMNSILKDSKEGDQELIVLDNICAPGSNGGPVFYISEPKRGQIDSGIFRLSGFVKGSIPDSAGKFRGLMTPAHFLLDLIRE